MLSSFEVSRVKFDSPQPVLLGLILPAKTVQGRSNVSDSNDMTVSYVRFGGSFSVLIESPYLESQATIRVNHWRAVS